MRALSSLFGVLFQIFLAYVLDYVYQYLDRLSLYAGRDVTSSIGQILLTLIFVISMLWLTKYVVLDNVDNLGLQISLMIVSAIIMIGSLLFHMGRGFVSIYSPLAVIWTIEPASYPAIACTVTGVASIYSLFAGEEVG